MLVIGWRDVLAVWQGRNVLAMERAWMEFVPVMRTGWVRRAPFQFVPTAALVKGNVTMRSTAANASKDIMVIHLSLVPKLDLFLYFSHFIHLPQYLSNLTTHVTQQVVTAAR